MPTTNYKCIHCGRIYDTYDKAIQCEKAHLPPKEIKELRYRYSPYPVYIVAKFEDGEEKIYLIYDDI